MTADHHSRTKQKRLFPLWEGRAILVGAGLAITVCVSLLLIFQPLLIKQADLRIYDLMLSGRSSPPASDQPVLVVIDEESLKAYGQWPWPRYRMARLVERLHDAGAQVVALDFVMPEPDRTSPDIIIAERQRDREPAAIIPAVKGHDSNSLRLAKALSSGTTVLGYFFDFVATNTTPEHGTPVVPEGLIVTKGIAADAGFPKPVALTRSIQVLTTATQAEGFTNTTHDCDGALRRVPLLLPYAGKLYPSLSLATLLLASSEGERRLALTNTSSETVLLWGKRRIPLDDGGNFLLNYRNEENSFTRVSARTVLEGKLTPEALKGKVILVGSIAKGLGDYHLVPSGRSVSGLTIHATVIDNILSGRFISRPGWARGAELCAILMLGLLSTWFLSSPGVLYSLTTVIAGSAACYWGSRQLLLEGGISLSPLLPMLAPIVILTFLSLLKYGIEARKLRHRNRDLIESQDTIIVSMSTLTATRDKETGGHIQRTKHYVEVLARQMATLPAYDELDENDIMLLTKSAPLHDIGKVGIPDNILHKEGKLTADELEVMKTHTLIGAEALLKTIGAGGHPENNDFLHYAQDMIESHHERWGGNGYPHGLLGDAIPLAGRLMALADVYDALTSKRIYKQAFSHEEAMEIILQKSGIQFDPDVVQSFNAKNEEFRRIAREFADEPH